MALFDADFLSILMHPNPRAPLDPTTKKPIPRLKERLEHLISTLEKVREKILIPTPALSEVLALAADKASDYLAELTTNTCFEIAPFDQVAAVEAAVAAYQAKQRGGKKAGSSSTWAKVKFDRQIIAIAKVRGVNAIYSNDEDIRKAAARENITVISVWDLPDPPPRQTKMFGEEEK
jgi:predicted nucleic acid-binding protein